MSPEEIKNRNIEIFKDWLSNPSQTQLELGIKYKVTATLISGILTKQLKLHPRYENFNHSKN